MTTQALTIQDIQQSRLYLDLAYASYRLHSERSHSEKIQTIVGDFSGTFTHPFASIVCEGFVKVVEEDGVSISWEEAAKPMGQPKIKHLQMLLEEPSIRLRFIDVHGREPCQDDVRRLYSRFFTIQERLLANFTEPLPGVKEVVSELRFKGYKIGATTGFPTSMMQIVRNALASQGVLLDAGVGCDGVVHGARPRPFMLYKCLDLLDSYPIHTVLKVGDTLGDVREGREAGCWSVGVTAYSSMMNIFYSSEEGIDLKQPIDPSAYVSMQEEIACQMFEAGAHYVASNIWDLPSIIRAIDERMDKGEKP